MDRDHFLMGGLYDRTTGTPRKEPCSTCAFRDKSPVRPDDFDRTKFLELCADLDDFVCHQSDSNGAHPSCAIWHRLFGEIHQTAS